MNSIQFNLPALTCGKYIRQSRMHHAQSSGSQAAASFTTGPHESMRPSHHFPRANTRGFVSAIKRVYQPCTEQDGVRILVDRLWPRGLSKAQIKIDYWAKDTAPSDELRKWYRHDKEKWDEFKHRYFAELEHNHLALNRLIEQIHGKRVTFVYGSKEDEFNNVRALKEYLLSYGLKMK